MHSVQPNLMLTVLAGKQLQTAKRTPRATLSGELLLRDVEFLGVRVNSDDFGAVDCLTALNHRQTHGSKAKDDRGGEGFNLKFGYAKMRSAASCWIDRFGSSTAFALFQTAPSPVAMPQPNRHILSLWLVHVRGLLWLQCKAT